jgi:hypothetical protein
MEMRTLLRAAAVSTLLAVAPAAIAQQGTQSGQPGVTSGPAGGTNVEPSTAVQKQNPPGQTTGATGAQGTEAAQGAMGAGAPGVSAKPGTQGGQTPEAGSK